MVMRKINEEHVKEERKPVRRRRRDTNEMMQ
jgi:hypothetical protein